MSNFKSITSQTKKKDYSIAELLGGSDAPKTTSAPKTANDAAGTFTPSKTASQSQGMSIAEILSGVDEGMSGVAKSLPGVTNIGAAIKSHYNTKGYLEDEAAAQAGLDAVLASKPGAYQESDTLKGLREDLTEVEGGKPDKYQSKYGDQISELIGKLGETEKFNYDVEGDPLWHSIKDQYQRNAMLGMQNAMGDAAALSGGYGNSYAAAAGQQAYQQSISEMTDIIPQLHDTALGAWQANRDALTDNLYAVMNAEDMEYSKWQDEYNMWVNDRDYLAQKIENMSDDEFNQWLAGLSAWQDERNYYAGRKDAAIANQQWQASMDESRRQFNQQMAFNYINMGVGAAVDLTTAGMSAGVQLAGIGADAALGAAGLALDSRQFDANLAEDARQFDAGLAHETAMSQQDYDLALKELAEEQRQFNVKNGVGTSSSGTQVTSGTVKSSSTNNNSGNNNVGGNNNNAPKQVYGPMTRQNVYSDIENSTDKKAAIRKAYINGVIDDNEYNNLKNKYKIYG